MLSSVKTIYGWGVRICAVATFGVGVYVMAHFLIPSFRSPMSDFIVAGKLIGPGSYCIDFYEPDHPADIIHYYFVNHASFYEAAQAGDHLRVAGASSGDLWGDAYRQLVRNGRIVARSFSDQQQYGLLFMTAALLPILVFLPLKNKVVNHVIWGVAVTGEIIVIGVLLFVALILYAMVHSTGC